MIDEYYSQIDTGYSERYESRNQKKINGICKHLQNESVKDVLDIGCNRGYVTKSLLDRNIIDFGYGVDLEKRIVDPELIRNERFTFFEEDVMKFSFPKKFDAIVYNSVHHHIFANFGSDAAFKIWQRIISNCIQFIFFETAVITERGPALYWKEPLGKKYKDDNHMISDIFSRIGPRLKNIEIIGSNRIHLSKRPLYKISLFPLHENMDFSAYVEKNYPEISTKDTIWSVEKEMLRTEGSINQLLVDREKLKTTREVNKNTTFFLLNQKDDNKKYFGKKYINDLLRQIRELIIIQGTDHPRILKTCFASEKFGLIFDFLHWQKIPEIDFKNIENKREFTKQIRDFFRYFRSKKVDYTNNIDPIAHITNRKCLYEIVDLNINNFLVQIENGKITDWKAIDFEFSLVNTRTRNKINYLTIIKTIKQDSRHEFIYDFRIRFYKTILYYSKQISSRLFYFNFSNLKVYIRKGLVSITRIIRKYLIKPFSK